MSNYQIINRSRHGLKHWRRRKGFQFAARETIAPLTVREFPRASVAMPIAFIALQESFIPVAVLGLELGLNLLVNPDGNWLAKYVPSLYRGYPFQMLHQQGQTPLLAFDEDSGLLTDDPAEEAFFAEDGKPSKAVSEVLDFLNEVDADRRVTAAICAALQKHGLIQPWALASGPAPEDRPLSGLYRIDEVALNALPDEDFLALRKAGAISLAYCQLVSMQHAAMLMDLAATRRNLVADLDAFVQGGTLDFSNL